MAREAGFGLVFKEDYAGQFSDFSNQGILKGAVWSRQRCVSLELRYDTICKTGVAMAIKHFSRFHFVSDFFSY